MRAVAVKLTVLKLVGGALDEDVQRPDDAGDGHQVEDDGAHDLATFARGHRQLLPLGVNEREQN